MLSGVDVDANINIVIVIVLDVRILQPLEMPHYICNVLDTDNTNVTNTTTTFAWLFITILCFSEFVAGL